jgi:hypothetical protein
MTTHPITIGPKNAEQMTGHTWRWLREHAAEMGVEVIQVDGKRFIVAAALLEALEKRSVKAAPEEYDERDELARMRARVAMAGAR